MNEIVKRYRSKNKNILSSFFKNLGLGHMLLFGFIGLVLIKITSSPDVDPRYNYIIYASLVGIILIIGAKANKEEVLLDKETATKIAFEEAVKMKNNGMEFAFDSKILPSGACNLVFTDNAATGYADYTSWEIGFIEYVHGTQYKKDYVIRIHPYKGIILGVIQMPLGFTGKETRDKEIIPVGIVMGTQKTTDIATGGVHTS